MKYFSIVLCLLLWTVGARAEFLDDLVLKDVASEYENTGEHDPGWTEFELVANYRYKTREGVVWVVPAGYVVDGASIPQAAWSLIGGPWSGRHRNAAVLHDWMCGEAKSNSDYVHRLFYDVLLESGVAKFKAKTMYIAVRRFGPQWEKAAGFGLRPEIFRPKFDNFEFVSLVNEARQKDLSIEQIDNLLDRH